MKKCFYIANQNDEQKILVSADEVDAGHFPGRFQCPSCACILAHQKSYTDGRNYNVRALFKHPKGQNIDCKERNNIIFTDDPINFDPLLDTFIDSEKQNRKKLEKAFINFLNDHIIGFRKDILHEFTNKFYPKNKDYINKIITYNETPGRVHKNPDLIIKTTISILESEHSIRFFNEEIDKFEVSILGKEKIRKYFNVRQEKNSGSLPIDTLIKLHCKRLKNITQYLSSGSSKDFKEKLLKTVLWADSSLPVCDGYLLTKIECENKNRILRKNTKFFVLEPVLDQKRTERIKLIQTFDTQILNEILGSLEIRNNSFIEIHKQKGLKNAQLTKNSNFIKYVLSQVLDAIKFYDWFFISWWY
jgi:hypothetical protein